MTSTKFASEDAAIDTLRTNRDAEQDGRLRCQLSMELLACTTKSTSVRIDKLQSAHAVREQEETNAQVLKQLRDLRKEAEKLENESAERSQAAATKIDIARDQHNACSVHLLELAETLLSDTEGMGLGSASARLRAFNAVLHADSSQRAVELRQSQEIAAVTMQEQKMELQFASDELVFHATALKLIKAVKHFRAETDNVRQNVWMLFISRSL